MLRKLRRIVNEYGVSAPLHSSEVLDTLGVRRLPANSLRFKWLESHECDALVRYGENRGYIENPQEDYEVQIPEVVLDASYRNTWEARYTREVLPIIAAAYGLKPMNIQSIQLAKYTPERRGQGTWHTDLSSDVTVTVNLGEPDGPMTCIYEGREIELEVAGKGEATVFLGKTTPHMGGKVLKEKNILVYWVEI